MWDLVPNAHNASTSEPPTDLRIERNELSISLSMEMVELRLLIVVAFSIVSCERKITFKVEINLTKHIRSSVLQARLINFFFAWKKNFSQLIYNFKKISSSSVFLQDIELNERGQFISCIYIFKCFPFSHFLVISEAYNQGVDPAARASPNLSTPLPITSTLDSCVINTTCRTNLWS